MLFPWQPVVLCAVAYLCGSIPFGLLVAKWFRGIDLRQHGSRNIGATNVGRVLGSKWGILVLLLDALKGLLPTLLLPPLAAEPGRLHLQVGCGIAAILGHMFPCWLAFRGGKGVATSLGVILVLAPWGTLTALLAFALTFSLFRIVSLSSIVAALVFGATEFALLLPQPFSEALWSLALFSLGAPLLVILQHRANIRRLLRGEESRFRAAQKAAETAGGETPSESRPQ